uniref:Uncharacterized protein n=1 Tax=Zeugodacus cucurbitae TaxID=28588 RepID=A0A0A1WQQ6_ZEUCU
MTISRRQPLLYFLLLILLLQWSTATNDQNDDTYYQDVNYYDTLANSINFDVDKALLQQRLNGNTQPQSESFERVHPMDSFQTDDDREEDELENKEESEMKRDPLFVTDDQPLNRKRDASDNDNSQHHEQEQKAAYTCHAQTPEQQACLDAAVKDTKDTIEHVTGLIKRMREHAVSIVKEINELEGDFLGACQDERPKAVCPKRPPSRGNCRGRNGFAEEDEPNSSYNDGIGGFKRIYVEAGPASNNQKTNENSNSPAALNDQQNENNNNGNEGGNNNQNVNTNTNSKPNSKGAPTKPRILVNEFAMPLKADISDLPPNEFIEQAQYAVHAWKNQIEECKRLLDEAMLRATQRESAEGVDNPNTSVQHIIKIITTPDEANTMHEDDVAPPAAASITPIHSASIKETKIANKNSNINIDNPTALTKAPLTNEKINDKISISGDDMKAVRGDNNNDADNDTDTDMNDSSNNSKRNDNTKKCRSDKEKKHRALPPLLSVLQGMGF